MPPSITIQIPQSGELPVACPAASPIMTVRTEHRLLGASKRVKAEVPGINCRVIHEPLDLLSDPKSPGMFCCSDGYRHCPIWQYDKDLIARGFHSMGDEEAMANEVYATEREDLTGSRHGDVSFLDHLEGKVQDAVRVFQDPEYEGFVRGEAG